MSDFRPTFDDLNPENTGSKNNIDRVESENQEPVPLPPPAYVIPTPTIRNKIVEVCFPNKDIREYNTNQPIFTVNYPEGTLQSRYTRVSLGGFISSENFRLHGSEETEKNKNYPIISQEIVDLFNKFNAISFVKEVHLENSSLRVEIIEGYGRDEEEWDRIKAHIIPLIQQHAFRGEEFFLKTDDRRETPEEVAFRRKHPRRDYDY